MELKRRLAPIILIAIMVLLVIAGLAGSIFLTVWLWKVLPGWAFFTLIGTGITSNIFMLWIYSN